MGGLVLNFVGFGNGTKSITISALPLSACAGQLKTIAILALLKIQIVTDSDEGCLMRSSFNSFCISFSHGKSTGIDVLTLYHQFGPTRFTPQNHLDRFAFLLLSHLLSFSLDGLFSFHQNKLFQSSCTFLWS